jgi:hypothetical protein
MVTNWGSETEKYINLQNTFRVQENQFVLPKKKLSLQSLYNKSPDIPQYKQKPARETYQLQRQA